MRTDVAAGTGSDVFGLPSKVERNGVFRLKKSFLFTVPEGYNHFTQLAHFKTEPREVNIFMPHLINDANFSEVSNQLLPGVTYVAELYSISGKILPRDCLEFLKSKESLMVGAQGLSHLLQEEMRNIEEMLVAVDSSDRLFADGSGYRRFAIGGKDQDGEAFFVLGFDHLALDGDFCVLCVKRGSANIQ